MDERPAVEPSPATDPTAARSDGLQLVGVSFDKVTRADEVLLALIHLQQAGELQLADAVVVAKTDDERVHVRQTVDVTTGRAALSGSMWGLLVGVIFGGPLLGLAVGAASGALAGRLIDLGLDDKWVRQVGGWLDPGTSALLVLVHDEVGSAVLGELGRFEGTVLYCTFPDAVRAELQRVLETDASSSVPLPPPPPVDPDAEPGI